MLRIPYGKGKLCIELPSTCDVNIAVPRELRASDEIREIERAIRNPINSMRLSEIAREGENAVIIVNDITRSTPTAKLLPPLISELYANGVKDIVIVFGLGLHRKQTEEEKKFITGGVNLKSIEHDINNCVYIGSTSRGTPVEIFKPVVEADIIICTGSIEYHYYAGYSGGAKSILPGVASRRSIHANHALMFDPNACAGRINSPVREDIEEAGGMLGIDFILNVVLNERKEIVFAVAGDYIDAHRKGVDFLNENYRIKVEKADIVIVSPGGWPRDINLFQSHKALEHVKNAVKDGGSIILVAECKEGYGNRVFEEWSHLGYNKIKERLKSGFVMGGHKLAFLAELSKKAELYLVSSLHEAIPYFKQTTIEDALENAIQKHGRDASILLVPYGVSTLLF